MATAVVLSAVKSPVMAPRHKEVRRRRRCRFRPSTSPSMTRAIARSAVFAVVLAVVKGSGGVRGLPRRGGLRGASGRAGRLLGKVAVHAACDPQIGGGCGATRARQDRDQDRAIRRSAVATELLAPVKAAVNARATNRSAVAAVLLAPGGSPHSTGDQRPAVATVPLAAVSVAVMS